MARPGSRPKIRATAWLSAVGGLILTAAASRVVALRDDEVLREAFKNRAIERIRMVRSEVDRTFLGIRAVADVIGMADSPFLSSPLVSLAPALAQHLPVVEATYNPVAPSGNGPVSADERLTYETRGADQLIVVHKPVHSPAIDGRERLHLGELVIRLTSSRFIDAHEIMEPAGIDMALYDVSGSVSQTLAFRPSRLRERGDRADTVDDRLVQVEEIPAGDRTWRVDAIASPAFLRIHRRAGHWWFLAGGVLLTGLVVQFLRRSDVYTDRVEREVAARTAELAALAESLERRVEERTVDLREANRELESFSYSVSHDLRAPLRGIAGFARLLREDGVERLYPAALDHLAKIERNAAMMGALIDDLLDFSRLGRRLVDRREFDLDELLDETLVQFEEEIAARKVEIVRSPLGRCFGDPTLLRQALANLIGNALKFTRTRQQPRIEFGAVVADGTKEYFVRDNGVGFDPRYVHKLFQVFQRLHSARDYEGTGVGLALTARIIGKHEGRIRAEGQVDAGATFHFTLGPAHR